MQETYQLNHQLNHQLNEIRAVLEQWLQAFNNKDIDTLMALYDSEAVYANASASLMRGVEQIQPWFIGAFEQVEGYLVYREEAGFAQGGMGFLVGAFYFKPPEGVTPPADAHLTGRVIVGFRQQSSGDWKVLMDMDNTPPDITPAYFSNTQ